MLWGPAGAGGGDGGAKLVGSLSLSPLGLRFTDASGVGVGLIQEGQTGGGSGAQLVGRISSLELRRGHVRARIEHRCAGYTAAGPRTAAPAPPCRCTRPVRHILTYMYVYVCAHIEHRATHHTTTCMPCSSESDDAR
eukprot:scaffold27451_cov169-Isochrysis_galbana.AAC.1